MHQSSEGLLHYLQGGTPIFKVVEEINIITSGDVVSDLRASLEDLGGKQWDVWAVIQTKAEE